MKNAFKKIFTIFMTLAVLVSSHTFAYYEHVCLLSKEKTFSLEPISCAGQNEESVPESAQPQLNIKTCCDLNLVLKAGQLTSNQDLIFSPSFLTYFFVIPSSFIFSVVGFLSSERYTFKKATTSPPFIIFEKYIRFEVFRI
jgi:hypothetical protein